MPLADIFNAEKDRNVFGGKLTLSKMLPFLNDPIGTSLGWMLQKYYPVPKTTMVDEITDALGNAVDNAEGAYSPFSGIRIKKEPQRFHTPVIYEHEMKHHGDFIENPLRFAGRKTVGLERLEDETQRYAINKFYKDYEAWLKNNNKRVSEESRLQYIAERQNEISR